MGSLAPLIIGLVSADFKSAARRAQRLVIFYIAAAMFSFLGLLALLMAAFIVMERHMAAEFAALAIAGILYSISLCLVAAVTVWSSRQRQKKVDKSAGRTITAAVALSVIPALLNNRSGLGLLAAAAGGYLLAARKLGTRSTHERKGKT
jgi:biotin transporter BioY